MKSKTNDLRTKIRDWFIITRIRILNFIKEHKYVSVGIGTFIISCIALLIVFATDNDAYAGKVTTTFSALQKGVSTSEEISEINSFSTIVYDLSYKLSVDELPEGGLIRDSVIIEASFNENVDASWQTFSDETTEYKLSEDKKTLTLTLYNVEVGKEFKQQLYLNVNNVKEDENASTPEITTTIKMKESTAQNYTEISPKSVSVNNVKTINNLSHTVVGGNAYNSPEYENGRLAPFGIILGIEKADLVNNSLEGIYFEPNANLVLTATQANNTQLVLSNSYGIYTPDLGYINGMPSSVYNSGAITSLTPITADATGENLEVSTPIVYLVGEKQISLKLGETYTEYGIKIDKGDAAFCKTSQTKNNCIRKVNEDEKGLVDTSKEGTYVVTYTYTPDSNTSITLKRSVVVKGDKTNVEAEEPIINEETNEPSNKKVYYSLEGSENVLLQTGEVYKVEGILKDGSVEDINFTYEIFDASNNSLTNANGVPLEKINAAGEYKIVYTVLGSDGQTVIKDINGKDVKLTRTVKITDLDLIETQVLTTNTIYHSTQKEYNTPNIKLDAETIKCTNENDCSATYYSDSSLQTKVDTESLNTTTPGTYYVKYSIKDNNDFELTAVNTINFQTIYELKIEGIKSNGELNLYGDFLALGMYYVNVESPREKGDESEIDVTLTANSKSATVANVYYSAGTKTNELGFYSNDTVSLEKLTNENNYLAYGEETILKSDFNYLTDGDDSITTLSNTISLGSKFSLLSYSSEFDTDLEYYLSVNGKRVVATEDNKLKYLKGTDEEGNPLYEELNEISNFVVSFNKNEEDMLDTVVYTATGVKPGTIIDFRLRLRTIAGNHGERVSASSVANYKQNNDKINESKSANADINITAFKSRTKLLINNNDYDVIVNGAKESDQISTWMIYPSVNMPAEEINTNIAGFDTISTITINVLLPKGVNYIYNESYDLPRVTNLSGGVTRLTYTLKNQKINEWIEPISFETDYDVNIPSGSNLIVSATITATATNGITDSSPEAQRTTKRTITYQNNEEIATGMHTLYSAISKDTAFDVETNIYNNSSNNYNNLELITILPTNEKTEKNDFNGTYTVKLPEGALCTNTVVTKDNLSSPEIVWDKCESNNYQDVIAVKETISNLTTDNRNFTSKITITPVGNKTDDSYTIKAYLKNQNQVIDIPSLTVNVISKKITGMAWEDFDSDGLLDKEEKKVSSVTLKLYNSTTNELVSTTTTDEKGAYSLTDIEKGKYYVVAEYNTAKYGLSPKRDDINDRSIKTSFSAVKVEQEDCSGDECIEQEQDEITIVRSEDIEITENTKVINNINIGLALRKEYSVKLRKYITRTIVTNNVGFSTIKDYGNVSLAKLDVKDINNLSIKVIYTIELENVGYYPGYIYNVKDYIPVGMKFNENYEENKGWTLNEDGYLENSTLSEELVNAGEKKYLNIAFDITKKEAGSFVNYAVVEDDDLQILTIANTNEEGVR